MATLSAHTDEATASRVSEMARLEDRTPSQITAAAVRWYVRLPPPARDALRRIEAQGELAIDEAAWAAGRALLDQQYDRAVQGGLSRAPSTLPTDASEEDILAEAVRMTRDR
jgi:predicted transcriptional regulator